MESADTAGQEKLAKALQACGVAILECSDELAEEVKPVSVEKRLCFDFEKVSKHEVMMTFLEMYERGLITGTKDALQTFLAVYSNLGTKESVHKLYVRCLNEYRKDKDHQGSTVFIYAPGSQYVDKQFILGKTLPDPPCVGREKDHIHQTKAQSQDNRIRRCIALLMTERYGDEPLFNLQGHWQAVYRILVDKGYCRDSDFDGFDAFIRTVMPEKVNKPYKKDSVKQISKGLSFNSSCMGKHDALPLICSVSSLIVIAFSAVLPSFL